MGSLLYNCESRKCTKSLMEVLGEVYFHFLLIFYF